MTTKELKLTQGLAILGGNVQWDMVYADDRMYFDFSRACDLRTDAMRPFMADMDTCESTRIRQRFIYVRCTEDYEAGEHLMQCVCGEADIVLTPRLRRFPGDRIYVYFIKG